MRKFLSEWWGLESTRARIELAVLARATPRARKIHYIAELWFRSWTVLILLLAGQLWIALGVAGASLITQAVICVHRERILLPRIREQLAELERREAR